MFLFDVQSWILDIGVNGKKIFITGHFFERVLSHSAKNEFSLAKPAKIILSLSKDDFCGVVK